MKQNAITAGIAVVVALIVSIFGSSNETIVREVIREVTDGKVGALSGPDIPWSYLSVGGLPTYETKVPVTSATTTVCNIQSPAGISKLLSYSVDFSTGTSSNTWVLATSSTPNALTTVLTKRVIDGNKHFTWSPMAATGTVLTNLEGILPGSTWVNFAIEGNATLAGNLSGTAPVAGSCSAVFQVIE